MKSHGDADFVFLGLVAILFMYSCSTLINHEPLAKEALQFRLTHSGLTNRICSKKDIVGSCKEWSIKDYDLHDVGMRQQLISLNFICMVGGKRFKIDPELPGLAKYKSERSCFIGIFCSIKPSQIKDRIAADTQDDIRKLVDAGTVCFSEREYPTGIPPG